MNWAGGGCENLIKTRLDVGCEQGRDGKLRGQQLRGRLLWLPTLVTVACHTHTGHAGAGSGSLKQELVHKSYRTR